jgi:hypothetical protein
MKIEAGCIILWVEGFFVKLEIVNSTTIQWDGFDQVAPASILIDNNRGQLPLPHSPTKSNLDMNEVTDKTFINRSTVGYFGVSGGDALRSSGFFGMYHVSLMGYFRGSLYT